MIENLRLVMKNAHTPYSNYKVACIIKMNNNQEFIGVNVENGSFKSGLCAEQVAISGAITEGYLKADFKELHVMGSGENYSYPCFLCRQWFVEFFEPNMPIYCYNNKGEFKVQTVAELCPFAFTYEEVAND